MTELQCESVVLGVVGGSGIYQMDGVEITAEHSVDTPFGKPSDIIVQANIEERKVFFLPRHGKGHFLNPSEIPYRANIYALKKLGVNHLLAVSAVGIMQEDIKPGDIVVPDQIFDRTKGIRKSTFFDEGIVGHVSFADPFCGSLRDTVLEAARSIDAPLHDGGTYVCMEGPAFSSRAESKFYRSTLKPSIIGMTALPEAKLAREAEMAYAMVATATDYDCWHETEEDVSVEAVLQVLKQNSQKAKDIVKAVSKLIPETSSSEHLQAAKFAIITDRGIIDNSVKERLGLLYNKYW